MARRLTTLHVLRTERRTPRMIRVVAGGEELAAFPDTPYTDRSVRLVFPRPGVRYPKPFDVGAIRAQMPREQWPLLRTYTVRALDHGAGELTIDFVLHGAGGVAAPWAASARPGDEMRLLGPDGAYAPDPAAAWHLLVGDESALPAIAAALERMPAHVPALVLIEVEDAAEEQRFATRARADVHWVHRDPARPDELVAALRALAFPSGEVHAFVHGEAGTVRMIRRHLVDERGLPRSRLSISGYWRRGRDEDGREIGRNRT